jgi:hypothetical protein
MILGRWVTSAWKAALRYDSTGSSRATQGPHPLKVFLSFCLNILTSFHLNVYIFFTWLKNFN